MYNEHRIVDEVRSYCDEYVQTVAEGKAENKVSLALKLSCSNSSGVIFKKVWAACVNGDY